MAFKINEGVFCDICGTRLGNKEAFTKSHWVLHAMHITVNNKEHSMHKSGERAAIVCTKCFKYLNNPE